MRRRASGFLGGSVLAVSGCITVTGNGEDHGALGGTAAYEEVAEPAAERAQNFVGVELEEALAGSLESLEFLSGLRVAAVAPGSPAEAAGLHAGDRIVRVGATELRSLDQWSAWLERARPGDELALTVEHDGGLRDVTLRVATRNSSARAPARRFVERNKARCVVETVVVERAGAAQSAAKLIELAASSPLGEAGLRPGDLLVALDGAPLVGAGDFARRVSARPYGASVTLGVADGERSREVDVTLFAPERHLVALDLIPLFEWSEAADDSRGEFELVDLWIFWLFKYRRDGETRRYSLLRFIQWETGVGALTEEPAGPGR